MEDQTLAEQFAKTGNIMDLCRDEAWVRESARIETECDGRIEAGLAMKAYAAAKYDPANADTRREMKRQVRVQSLLFSELKRWMAEWDIGVSFEATYTEARQLVRSHLEQPTPALKGWVEAVFAEDNKAQELVDKSSQAQVRTQLVLMLTSDDWENLANVAAESAACVVSARVFEVSETEHLSTAA